MYFVENRRKILAVSTQLKQFRKESLKKIPAQLVEHCTGRIPFKPEFFQAFFSQLLKRTNDEDLSFISCVFCVHKCHFLKKVCFLIGHTS